MVSDGAIWKKVGYRFSFLFMTETSPPKTFFSSPPSLSFFLSGVSSSPGIIFFFVFLRSKKDRLQDSGFPAIHLFCDPPLLSLLIFSSGLQASRKGNEAVSLKKMPSLPFGRLSFLSFSPFSAFFPPQGSLPPAD